MSIASGPPTRATTPASRGGTPSSLTISSTAHDIELNDELAELCSIPREPAYLCDRSKGDLHVAFHRWRVIQRAITAWKDLKLSGNCPSHFSKVTEEMIINLVMGKTNYHKYNASFKKLVEYDKSCTDYHINRYGQMVDWLEKKPDALSDIALWDGIPKTRDGYSYEKLQDWLKLVDSKAKRSHKKSKKPE